MYKNFDELINRISPRLRGIAHRMNGHHTFFSDEDLFQEASIRLWILHNRGYLHDKTDSYVLQGCYYHLKNYLRTSLDKVKKVRIEDLINESADINERFLAAGDSSKYDKIDENLLSEKILEMGLCDREKTVLDLTIKGHTVREIGNLLGVSHVAIIKVKAGIKLKCRSIQEITDINFLN